MTMVEDGIVSEAHVEPVESHKQMFNSIDDDPVYSYREQRKIIRRIDARLIVMLGFLHTVSLIDRGNLGTASVAGMEKELRLKGTQYVCWLAGSLLTCETDNITEHNCSGVLPSLYLPTNIWPHSSSQDRSDPVSLGCLFLVGSCYGKAHLRVSTPRHRGSILMGLVICWICQEMDRDGWNSRDHWCP